MTEQCIRALRAPFLHQEKRKINQLPSDALKAEKDTSRPRRLTPSCAGWLAGASLAGRVRPLKSPSLIGLMEPAVPVHTDKWTRDHL